ncbi:3-isopropylmalate dehydratase small subunit [Oceaniglobus indicus]|uniref:3-isopropylmalate dehydratase small subunit n=1 Tax=Oceaniglobus indicus TaxID=2047749 RepID=UPI000C193F26|nr:3-isopropylmalate dehydratase small subunit [Oceaniglobus indicus]
MTGWRAFTGRAVVFAHDNVDTDQLIPARFMSAPRAQGYGRFLLHDHPDRDTLSGAEIVIAGRNFGCGSSREAAVYALVDAGIRAVIAPGFGDIFAANAVNNGLLPAVVADTAALRAAVDAGGEIAIDLEKGTLSAGEITETFTLDAAARDKIVNGWDDIDLTASHTDTIATFIKTYHGTYPWSRPNPKGEPTCA